MATVDVVTVADIRGGIELGRVDIEQVRDLAPGMAELRYRMGTGASVTALLVEPDEAPLAAVLVVHPATGDRMSLLADAHALSQHRVRCLLPELPREQWGTVDEGVASRVAWIETLCAGLALLRGHDPNPRSIGYIGKNLGGALAGAVCAVDGGVTAAVAVAPLLDIGGFFTDANHPIAESRRASEGLANLIEIRDATAALELQRTVGSSPATRWLVQLGRRDNWSPADEAAAHLRAAAPDAEVVIFDTADHDLVAAAAAEQRVAWLCEHLLNPT